MNKMCLLHPSSIQLYKNSQAIIGSHGFPT